jgi:hypothetical protein
VEPSHKKINPVSSKAIGWTNASTLRIKPSHFVMTQSECKIAQSVLITFSSTVLIGLEKNNFARLTLNHFLMSNKKNT